MTILFFGTYDQRRHPRVRVLIEGCRGRGDEVIECNEPLGDSTDERVAMLRRPWMAFGFVARLGLAWRRLIGRARSLPAPDMVIVGYLGHLDVHLARRLWPRTPIVLDHLISLADTAADRRSTNRLVLRGLEWLDRAALRAADVAIVDTEEHRELVPSEFRSRVAVVEVGAPRGWFTAPLLEATRGRLHVVFFGLFTPLQGAQTIARALALLADAPIDFLMIGTGQDYDSARRIAAGNQHVQWRDWAQAEELPGLVASHDVCLGIFGPGKGLRVVPNKVFQGAAAGCAVVTADTPPQRRALADAAIFVPPGSAEALADALAQLQRSPKRLAQVRRACYERACARFPPDIVVGPLYDAQTANKSRLRPASSLSQ